MKLIRSLKSWLFILGPSITLGIIVGLWPGYRTYEYVWKDDRFCLSCHVHDYATVSWKNSVHGKLTTCHDCHHQPLHQYFYEAYVMVTKRPKFPKDLHHTPYVPRDLCVACHVNHADQSTVTGPLSPKMVEKLPKVDHLWLHQVHLSKKVKLALPSTFSVEEQQDYGFKSELLSPGRLAAPPNRLITCVDCHGAPPNRAHNFTAADRSCIRCHGEIHHKKLPKQVGCRSCHYQDFMIPIERKLRQEEIEKLQKESHLTTPHQ